MEPERAARIVQAGKIRTPLPSGIRRMNMFKDVFKETTKDIKDKKKEIDKRALEKVRKQESFLDFIRYEEQKKRYTEEFLEELFEMDYSHYLRTPHWDRVKKAAYGKHGRSCFHCGSKIRLHVHHLTYERRGRENMEDLMILCDKCHDLVHKTIDEVNAERKRFISGMYH